jgi:hypothetical protein
MARHRRTAPEPLIESRWLTMRDGMRVAIDVTGIK